MSNNLFGSDNNEELFDLARKVEANDGNLSTIMEDDKIDVSIAKNLALAGNYTANLQSLGMVTTLPILEILARGEFGMFRELIEGFLALYEHVTEHSEHQGPAIWEDYRALRDQYTMYSTTMKELEAI